MAHSLRKLLASGTTALVVAGLVLAPAAPALADSFGCPVFTSVANGRLNSLAIGLGGTVWAWGYNNAGQLGDGTTADHPKPAQVPGLPAMTGVAGGNAHTVAVGGGRAWTWGQNVFGQLGDGTYADRLTPAQVSSLSGITAVAAGNGHSLAIGSAGRIYAWGYNGQGQLGDGSAVVTQPNPVQVSGLTGVTAISAAGHSLAIGAGGTVWAWGSNDRGQLGDGTTTDRHTPVQVPGLSGITAIAAGNAHSLAVGANGALWAWGMNNGGQLGDGTTTDRHSPYQVPGLTGITSIAAGISSEYSLAVDSSGRMWGWGVNYYGQLGDGTTTERHSPEQIPGMTGVAGVAGAQLHSLALKTDGTVLGTGYNAYGAVGDGTTTDRTSLTQVACGTAGIALAPTSRDFGSVPIGVTSPPSTVTVSNPGTAPLTVSGIAISGTNAADFAKPADGCSGVSVPAGGSCTFQLTFTPSVAGSRTATATVSSNAGNPTVALSGSGTIAVPGIGVSSTSIDFGPVGVGSSSPANVVTVSSNGTATLTVSAITVAGANVADFTVSSDTCTGSSMPVGSTCTFNIRFSPGTTGSRSATVTIASNAGNRTISLAGTGAVPGVSASTSTLNFGYAAAGTPSAPRTVTVTSTGAMALTIGTLSIGGTNADEFAIDSDGCSNRTLAPNATCAVDVTFTPAVSGARTANLAIPSNAAGSPLTVLLKGIGDDIGPQSAFTTASPTILLSSQPVTGITTDDLSGVATVRVTFTPILPIGSATTVTAVVTCTNGTRRSCDWSATIPATPGIYVVSVRATDIAGNVESPGPAAITIINL